MMKGIAVHLMNLQIGIYFVKHVNAVLFVKTIGPRKNVARNVMQRNVRNPNPVRQTARSLAIYVELLNLAKI